MKLYYFNHTSDSSVNADFSNFGDDLNATLWEGLFPGAFDADETTILTGVGSFLNQCFAQRFATSKKIVFGTGYGYGESIGSLDDTWEIHFVRGPETAKALGLNRSAVIADAAYLIRHLRQSPSDRKTPVSIMPHCFSMELASDVWQSACDENGFELIDPRSPVDVTMSRVARSHLLCTEALHGAIVADALRTPWIPFISNPFISALKWRDWCGSIFVDYRPVKLVSIWPKPAPQSVFQQLRRSFKTRVLSNSLRALPKNAPQLSGDKVLASIDERLACAVDNFRSGYRAHGF